MELCFYDSLVFFFNDRSCRVLGYVRTCTLAFCFWFLLVFNFGVKGVFWVFGEGVMNYLRVGLVECLVRSWRLVNYSFLFLLFKFLEFM